MRSCRVCGKGALLRAGGIAASALAIVVASGPAAGAPAKPRSGGTVVIGVPGEPSTLSWIVQPALHIWAGEAHWAVFGGPYRPARNLTYRPYLVTHGRVVSKPFSITYFIRPKANWSDGRPITASDFIFTWRTIVANMAPADTAPPTVYHDIVRARALDRKTVRFTFRAPVADWRDLFWEILPRHALDGVDFARTWLTDLHNPKTGRPIASGPFRLVDWRRGHSMTFARNERYFGRRPFLRSVVFRFLPDDASAAEALRRREIDVLWTQPQQLIAALRGTRGIRVRTVPQLNYEALWFNLGHNGGGHQLLRRRFVREAVARAVDRRGLVREVYGEIGRDVPVNHSAFIAPQSRFARPWWKRYAFRPATSRRILERNGCRLGTDGVYVCGGRRVSFRLSTTAGNQLREVAARFVQRSLSRAGIHVTLDHAPPPVFFGPKKTSGDYDIAMFAWSHSPSLASWEQLYGCRNGIDGKANDQGYCNTRVTKLLRAASRELDQSKQAAIANRALALMASDLPILPLFQKPTMLAHLDRVRGLEPSSVGLLNGVERWWKQ